MTTSCTNRLIAWSRAVLQPAGVPLTVRLAKLYRAHWEEGALHKTEDERLHYGERAGAAREGMRLLMAEPTVRMEMMDPADWRYLASLSDGYVLEKLVAAEARVPFAELEVHEAEKAAGATEDGEVTVG